MDAQKYAEALRKLNYNMVNDNVNDIAKSLVSDLGAGYKALKVKCHKALGAGRDNMRAGRHDKANSNFAYAYQMRCVCNYIWVNWMHQPDDKVHNHYLVLQRKFSQFALNNGKLSDKEKAEVEAAIAKIHDADRYT